MKSLHFPLGLTGGLQPVQSPLRLVTAKDKLATINCNERESTPQSMLWYRQSAGQGLTLIGYIQVGGMVHYEKKDQTRFEITGDGDRNSVAPTLSWSEPYLLMLFAGASSGDVVHQWPFTLAVKEEGTAKLNCYQNGSTRATVLWYRQLPGKGLALIGYLVIGSQANYEEEFNSGFAITRSENDKKSELKLDRVKGSDSAVYYCAASDGAQRLIIAHRHDKNFQ
ncbi:hypothetical protein chiPu_0012176 [Chiloscyllium punctatum]|uniref:Ig-like domain-containing protein n=1 Tax=Chiloscyllium punctatum TaxID=137246 RepID=A0A401STK9_CHIPU|nr:hypothetical protein [Chiloscyllium punctatum]